MKQIGAVLAVLTVCIFCLSACSTGNTPTPVLLLTLPPIGTAVPNPDSNTEQPTPGASTLSPTPSLSPVPPNGPQDSGIAVQAAISILAEELKINDAEIALVSAQPHEWPDASLGCPAPGQVYPQVMTSGFIVTLIANDVNYEVHTDTSGTAVICASPGTVPPESAVSDPIVEEFIAQAKRELSQQIGINTDQIALVRSEAVDWRDSSLGCAQSGQAYLAVITPGYRIILAAGDQWYEFHTDQQRMTLCAQPTE